jgi:tRNA(Arg) A34 adenosine deaminase TadA
MANILHPPKPTAGPLVDWWEKPVLKLLQISSDDYSKEEKERHCFYSLLTLALVSKFWNGNKQGNSGNYPWREEQNDGDRYWGGDYLGHNIVAIAVDKIGELIDFDFNHNKVLDSSVEHAESRLIRRVFSLNQLYDNWETGTPSEEPSSSYANKLSDVTIYTSLESCSQCAGIMTLASVSRVVFLQRDPGQYSIGNILRNLTPSNVKYRPPLPIPADVLGFSYFQRLADGFEEFVTGVKDKPFWISNDKSKIDDDPSITSYLCTDHAKKIFSDALKELTSVRVHFPSYRPRDKDGKEIPNAKTNSEVYDHVIRFFKYAVDCGHRGTPHRV